MEWRSTGDVYEGQWEDDTPSGYGVYTWAPGAYIAQCVWIGSFT
jgi:hypothetical protein